MRRAGVYFYTAILPTLKQRGKTVIAACHDDRYFHCADQVVTMEYGRIRAALLGSSREPLRSRIAAAIRSPHGHLPVTGAPSD